MESFLRTLHTHVHAWTHSPIGTYERHMCSSSVLCMNPVGKREQRGRCGRHATLFSYFAVSENLAVKVRDHTSSTCHIERFCDQHHNKLRHSCRQWHSDALSFRRTGMSGNRFQLYQDRYCNRGGCPKTQSSPKKRKTVGDMITHFLNCHTPQLWDYIETATSEQRVRDKCREIPFYL